MLTLASYNIQYGTGADGRVDLARIAAEIAPADIIALQEVTTGFARGGLADQAGELAALLDRYMVFGATFDVDASARDAAGRVVNRRRRFGNAILSRWPIRSSRTIALPMNPLVDHYDLQRSATEGLVVLPGGFALRVYSAHLSHVSAGQRLPQLATLMDAIARAPTDGMAWHGTRDESWTEGWPEPALPAAAVLMGDMNFAPSDPEYPLVTGELTPERGRLARRSQMRDAWVLAGHGEGTGWSLHERRGEHGSRIDHCFVTPDLAPRIRRAWIDEAATGSDHLPLFVTLDPG
ncbi:MAG: endonuclease/exonuclease/phosphatase family protein [Alphaproteobacteria bacterium]|nr:endonuclease/exonuclease/phosphatase family protein [Alphaproteobacteria bacterium]